MTSPSSSEAPQPGEAVSTSSPHWGRVSTGRPGRLNSPHLPLMSDIHTYSICVHEHAFDPFKKWLKKEGFIFQGRPSYRRLFRSLREDNWRRLDKRPLPKHTFPGPRLQKIAIDIVDWKHVCGAITQHYHNDPTNLLIDLYKGNWTRQKTTTSKAAEGRAA